MKKIIAVTSSRADYYLLKPLLEKLSLHKDVNLEIMVTGSHLLSNHGSTVADIKKDFSNIHTIKLLDGNTHSLAIHKNLPHYLKHFLEFFDKSKPDLLILLGDRYEIFLAAIASLFNAIPIAHIHGGEVTHGAIDDPMRHSITKMSHLHFVSNSIYKNRVKQLGEQPSCIFNVGPMVIDNLLDLKFYNKSKLCDILNIKKLEEFLLVTFHPETYGNTDNSRNIAHLLKALKEFPTHQLFFTAPNLDQDGDLIRDAINIFVGQNPNAYFFESLGGQCYLSLMRHASCVVGNSSSGIIEAPLLGIPTVNIGSRQSGRHMSKTIFSSLCKTSDIIKTIRTAVRYKDIHKSQKLSKNDSPSSKIIKVLQNKDFFLKNHKKFNDII
jgi:GDP/UDP-N,N'-diacetylbacillosamine 2-epimerase (hydrolysing)